MIQAVVICRHHWRIAFPAGPTSKGVCERCGEQREFRNSEDYFGPEHRTKAHVMYSTSGAPLRLAEAVLE